LATAAVTVVNLWCHAVENMYSKAFSAIDSGYSVLNQVRDCFQSDNFVPVDN